MIETGPEDESSGGPYIFLQQCPAMSAPSDRRRLWKEVIALYAITLVATGGLALLQGSVDWLRGILLVIAAAVFLYLPIEVLYRQGIDPADLGIHRRDPWRAIKLVLLLCVIVFPPYVVGFHYWQTSQIGKRFAPDEARFDQWPVELGDAPRVRTLRDGEVRLFRDEKRFWLQWHLPAGQSFEARIESDEALRPAGGPLRVADANTLIAKGRSDGQVKFEVPGSTLEATIQAGGDRLPAERLRLGTALKSADENPYRAERGYWWLINLLMVQLLLVALPEEVFYRGYLQSRLDGLIGRDRRILGVEMNVSSTVLTSVLFAIGHVVTIQSPTRLAVFFPSLLFGWMRRATGGVLAPILFHAICNIAVQLLSQFYAR